MSIQSAFERPSLGGAWIPIVLISLLTLTACGTFEVGIERAAAPSTTNTAPVTATIAETRRTVPSMMTPTSTPAPVDGLFVAFVREGDVWLWMGGGGPVPLTHTGDVGENSVRISDDGAVIAFARGRELWAIDADGANERKLVSEMDYDRMEPTEPGVSLYRYDWAPGTHTLAFNTLLHQQFGVDPTDDLHLVDADTLEHTTLLAPGEGGHFAYSPDGSQIAIVRSGTIDLIDADGGNRRSSVLTYTPSKAYAEDRYYAEPAWAADGGALGVAIPPPDPDAQPAQHTTVWRVPVDGKQGRLVANLTSVPLGPVVFSPDLAYAAYITPEESAPTSTPANLMIAAMDSAGTTKETTTVYATRAFRFAGWAPDGQHFAFISVTGSDLMPIQAEIGRLGHGAVPVDSDQSAMILDIRWIDDTHFLSLAKSDNDSLWLILSGRIGGPSTIVASIPESPGADVPSYDFADTSRKAPIVAVPRPTPERTPPPLPRPSALHVAYIKDGDVWLWKEGPASSSDAAPGTVRVTAGGSVTEVRISGDGEVLAFARDGELWAVEDDGSNERRLVSAAELSEMEPIQQAEFPIVLNRFEWVPGTHTVAFNTRLDLLIGLMLNDDLHRVDADSLGTSLLLPPGQGGEFTYSPDGRQVAVANRGGISLYDADGQNRRDAFTYTPVATSSEHRYYAQPVWEAYSQSLRVAIPPVDPFAQPPQPTSIWRLPTDGTPATLIGNIVVRPNSQPVFSPELKYVAYLEYLAGAIPGDAQGMLLITNLETGETIGKYPQAHNIYGWAPDSAHLAFLAHPESPQAQIASFGGFAVPAHDDAEVTTIDVRWVDASRYLYLASTHEGWSLLLGEIGGSTTVLATVAGRSLPYDVSY